MLGRAKNKYEASKPAAQPELQKDHFPSSSPAYRDGDIATFAHGRNARPTQTAFASAARGSTMAPGLPLNPKPDHNARRPLSTNSVTSFVKPTSGLNSLLSQSDSFKDEPVTSFTGSANPPKAATPVYIAEDDFSDDDNLELDYECPSTLPPPSLPRQVPSESRLANKPTPNTPQVQSYVPSPATSTTYMPWTSSPLEHMYPPPKPRRDTLKRESPENAMPAPKTLPVAKKRKLPAGWKKPKEEETLDLFEQHEADYMKNRGSIVKEEPGIKHESDNGNRFASFMSTATPATKTKSAAPWETTPGALQAKRTQLKIQGKVKSESSTDLSMEEIKAATAAHHKVSHSAMSLSAEQQQVLELVVEGKKSVFFTGPAGTGKSVLMRAIIAALKKKWVRDPERLSITASTGLAACNIGGMTLHSFSGIGLGKEDVPTLVKKIRRNPKAKNRWLRTKVLIVDEISMVDGDLFDKLSQIARQIRNDGRPWGGIQLVITGDYFQLPPVPDRNKRDTKFAFDAATWSTSIDHTIGLTQVFRQKDHGEYWINQALHISHC